MQTTESTTPQTDPSVETQPSTAVTLPPLLQIWYHEGDFECLNGLNPYLHRMESRLGDQVACKVFGYREPAHPPVPSSFYTQEQYQEAASDQSRAEQKYQRHHVWALEALKRTILLVIFASNSFMAAFEADLKQHPDLAAMMEHPPFKIMPFPVRPTETGKPFPCSALCSIEGVRRDQAFVEVTGIIERLVRQTMHLETRKTAVDLIFQSEATVQPSLSSLKTPTDLAIEMFAPVKGLLEQASAQIVESQQLALTERSTRLATEQEAQIERQSLASQFEELRKQLSAPQTKKASLLSRLRRRG